jgi:hypothetical protein
MQEIGATHGTFSPIPKIFFGASAKAFGRTLDKD